VTDNITLPRAVALQIREALMVATTPIPADRHTVKAASTALDAALAEPPAKPEPATYEQAQAAHRADCYMEGIYRWHDYHTGWQAAERFHGITKEDKT